MKKTTIFAVIILLCSAIALGCIGEKQEQTATEETQPLLVYCGAGMKKPMDEFGPLFEQKYGVKVIYNYAGSGHLLNQMELAQQGDVYQPGSTYYFDIAREEGLIDYEKRVAYHVPVIAVPKGNPANVTCLNDLTKPGVKVDAAITWEETVLFAPDETDIIEIPEEKNIIKIIPIGTVTFSENKKSARKFVDFITSDEGKAIYEKYGFTPYRQGDINETDR